MKHGDFPVRYANVYQRVVSIIHGPSAMLDVDSCLNPCFLGETLGMVRADCLQSCPTEQHLTHRSDKEMVLVPLSCYYFQVWMGE